MANNTITVTAVPGDGRLTVSWQNPERSGVVGFQVRWRPQGTTGYSTALAGSTAESHTITGLANGVRYEYQVRVLIQDAIAKGTSTPVRPRQAPVNTVPPAITGEPVVGGSLSASTGSWDGDPTNYTYTWQRQ